MAIKTVFSLLILCIGLSAQAQESALAPTIENLGKYLQGRAEFVGTDKEFAQFVLNAVASSEGLHNYEGRPMWSRIAAFIGEQRQNAVSEYALVSRAKNVVDVYEGYRAKAPDSLVVEPYVDEIPPEMNGSAFKRWLYRAGNQAFRSICSRALDPLDFKAMYDYENRLRVTIPAKK